MPTTYAHYRFGKEVTEALPRGLQNTIEYHRDLYDIGLHGPDILFYYKALKSHPVNQQGHTVHENFADTFFEHAVSVIEKAEDPAAARVYIYGVICHFALDSECHPYIEKMIQESGISHCELEMEFDRMLMSDGSRRNSDFRDTQVDIKDNSWSFEAGGSRIGELVILLSDSEQHGRIV